MKITAIETMVVAMPNRADVGRNGPAMHALSAMDIAPWDIAGKLAGRPLCRLLGGGERASVPACASVRCCGAPHAVSHCTERALRRGYRHSKLHEITEAPREQLVERHDADFECNPLHGAIDPGADGRFAVPQGPGLGHDPDPAIIARLRVA